MDSFASTFASNLKRLRTERFLTQKQLADAIRITTRTLIRWENAEGEPGISELRMLASFFDIGIDQLISDLLPPNDSGALARVADLACPLLDYWIARTQGMSVELTPDGPVMYEAGVGQSPVPQFSGDLALIEPLMRGKGVQLETLRAGAAFDGAAKTGDGWVARCNECATAYWGKTIAEAGARAWLASEVGPVIAV
uniref:Transcriptional regulator, XRE family n=1 Tax=Variovorax paradoxus (strain S110) TaxID=543728 RepID=C5CJM1_VARPS